MSQNKRYYSLVFAPRSTSKLYKVSICYTHLYFVCAFVLILLASLVAASTWALMRSSEIARLSRLNAELRNLKNENQSYKNKLDKINGQVAYIDDLSKKLSRTAGLQRTQDIDEFVGIGGPVTVEGIEQRLDQLETELRQLSAFYDAQQLILNSIPRGWPAKGYLTGAFGNRHNPFGKGIEFHSGQDISVNFGAPVSATADGLVIFAASYAGYGNVVVIDHGNGYSTRYGHLSAITVQPGQRVRRGDILGQAGSTGRSTGPHVHYEVRKNNQPENPLKYARF